MAEGGDQRADAADFVGAISGTASFSLGMPSATFTVVLQPDLVPEANEFFVVRLQCCSVAARRRPSSAVSGGICRRASWDEAAGV